MPYIELSRCMLRVSSHTPSLLGLIRMRERVRAQRQARAAAGTASAISFAAPGQTWLSADKHASRRGILSRENDRRIVLIEAVQKTKIIFRSC